MPKPIENWITFPDRVLCESFLSIGFEHVWAPRSLLPIGLFFALFPSFSVYPWDRFGAILGDPGKILPNAFYRFPRIVHASAIFRDFPRFST